MKVNKPALKKNYVTSKYTFFLVYSCQVWIPAAPMTLGGHYSEYERIVQQAPGHSLWARFYDLQTKNPLFYDWSRRQVTNLYTLSRERRGGYAYYSDWPESLLRNRYPGWKKWHGLE